MGRLGAGKVQLLDLKFIFDICKIKSFQTSLTGLCGVTSFWSRSIWQYQLLPAELAKGVKVLLIQKIQSLQSSDRPLEISVGLMNTGSAAENQAGHCLLLVNASAKSSNEMWTHKEKSKTKQLRLVFFWICLIPCVSYYDSCYPAAWPCLKQEITVREKYPDSSIDKCKLTKKFINQERSKALQDSSLSRFTLMYHLPPFYGCGKSEVTEPDVTTGHQDAQQGRKYLNYQNAFENLVFECYNYFVKFQLLAAMIDGDDPHLKISQTKQQNSLGNCTPHA
ncbi:hypothetical protein AAES_63361 [Amazona aestiva]|uniref:Uncharacterized protein n=1 Tax=Amazona aestiva TaxID=12930 RepID=A0A0Q3RCB3_AMAAE|nr:hypothetical protein AAES_63361 [Amazona aestiva]